jgi:glutathione synthase/RimK-type ligase-like ATP-grasp enzyme
VCGNSETVPLYQVPPQVLHTALKAARLVGDGLYGVDLKQIGDRVMVIEVNDNPNLDAGIEDHVEGEALYRKIAMFFRERIESQRGKA